MLNDAAPDGLVRDWDFRPSRSSPRLQLRRWRERLSREAAPMTQLLKVPQHDGSWVLYFLFSPDGQLGPAHHYTLNRLADLQRRVLIVCATPDPLQVPRELFERCDALAWKALPGFDFSAYAVGLWALARHVRVSDVLVMNDSVFGPLVDMAPWLNRMTWDLSGFTATSNVENHVQSYAFVLHDPDVARLSALSSVLSLRWSYDRFWGVVLNQETKLAHVASRSMSVGALLYADTAAIEDPTLQLALPLARAGFPFLKRSFLGKLAHLAPRKDVLAILEEARHPL